MSVLPVCRRAHRGQGGQHQYLLALFRMRRRLESGAVERDVAAASGAVVVAERRRVVIHTRSAYA